MEMIWSLPEINLLNQALYKVRALNTYYSAGLLSILGISSMNEINQNIYGEQ